MIRDILGTIGFREEESNVYIALIEGGSSSAGALAKKMHLPRPTIYGYLDRLKEAGLAEQTSKSGVKVFQAAPPSTLHDIYKKKINTLQDNARKLDSLVPELEQMSAVAGGKPQIHIFEGAKGAKQLWEDVLLYPNTDTLAFWPVLKMMHSLDEDFIRYHNRIRVEKNIKLKAIWFKDRSVSIKRIPSLKNDQDNLRETRMAPENIDTTMGYWIYGPNKVMLLSTNSAHYGMLIESKEYADLMRAQHGLMWQISTPLHTDS